MEMLATTLSTVALLTMTFGEDQVTTLSSAAMTTMSSVARAVTTSWLQETKLLQETRKKTLATSTEATETMQSSDRLEPRTNTFLVMLATTTSEAATRLIT